MNLIPLDRLPIAIGGHPVDPGGDERFEIPAGGHGHGYAGPSPYDVFAARARSGFLAGVLRRSYLPPAADSRS